MKAPVLYVTLGVTAAVAAVLVWNMLPTDSTTGTPGTIVPACEVNTVPFAVGLTVSSNPSFDPIHEVASMPASLPNVLELQDDSKLMTSFDHLCPDPASPLHGSACGGIDSFTWGLDWIPLKANEDETHWYLTDFMDELGEGWGILFFERGGNVYAWGWGPQLDLAWPKEDTSTIPTKTINQGLMRESTTPAGGEQPILHRKDDFGLRKAIVLDGLDFHAWVPNIGPGWDPECFTPPGGSLDVDPRLHYTLRRPDDGVGNEGAVVWWTEPQEEEGGLWAWSEPQQLCTNEIPNLPDGADIDALAYYALTTDEAGEAERMWLTQATERETGDHAGLPVVGLVMFSLTEDSFPGEGKSTLESEDAYWVVSVHSDSASGDQVFGQPRPVMTHLDVPLGAIVGPRSRGVCPSDPRILRPSQREGL